MSLVKIIDVSAVIRELLNAGGDHVTPRPKTPDMRALIVGKERFILSNDEAVHEVRSRRSSMFLDLEEEDGVALFNGVIVRSSGRVEVPAEEFLRVCLEVFSEEFVGGELGEWVRRFGSRIENNYEVLLDSIKTHLSLDPKDYPRGVIKDGVWSEWA